MHVPDTAAGPSNNRQVVRNATPPPIRVNEQWYDEETSDDICMEVMDHVEKAGLYDVKVKIFLILMKGVY